MYILSLLFVSFFSYADAPLENSFRRFDKSQLTFHLVNSSSGEFISCKHKPLESVTPVPPPPWWVVECGDRKYTVDLWLENKSLASNLNSVFLLYHAKESISSSGESQTRFETQTTEFFYNGDTSYKAIRSSIDVRNGLADLYVTVSL